MSISVYGKAATPQPLEGTTLYASGYSTTGQVTFTNFEKSYYAAAIPGSAYTNVGAGGITPQLFSFTGPGTSFTLKMQGEYSIPTSRSVSSTLNAYGLGKIQYFNGKYIKFNPSSTSLYYSTSTDGMAWTDTTIAYQPWNLSIANNIAFVGVKSNANAYYTSTDGTTWTSRTLPTTTHADLRLHHVFYIGTTYVAITQRSSTNSGTVHSYTSSDGINWTYGAQISIAANTGTNNFIYAAASSSTIVVLSDGSVATSHTPYYSTTGSTWTSCGLGLTKASKAIEYVNGNFVFFLTAGTNASTEIRYSTAGTTTWTSQTVIGTSGTNTPDINGLIWDGTYYIFAFDGSTQFYYYNTVLNSAFTSGGVAAGANPGISYANSKYFVDNCMNVSAEVYLGTLRFWGPSRFSIFKYPTTPVYN